MRNLELLLPREYVPEDKFTWATVTSVSPVQIRLDGEAVALDVTCDSLVDTDWLDLGRRVWVQIHGRRLIVLGQSGKSREDALDSGWITPTLTNGWANYSANYNPGSYRRLNGVVYLRGLVKDGTHNSGIFTLPAGFRPAFQCIFTATQQTEVTGNDLNSSEANSGASDHHHHITNGHVRLDVRTDGIVVPQGQGEGSWISLDGICFFAEL